MHLFGKDLNNEVAVVAEIGVNHEGNLGTAMALLKEAAEAGADAVKFQSYTPERFVSGGDPDRLARIRRFALDADAHQALAREAVQRGISFFSTAVSEDWVPTIARLSSAIKIASADLTFEPVVRAAAATGRIVLISTGLGTPAEIDRTVQWVMEEIGSAALAERLVLLQCTVAYPTPIEQSNTLTIPWLAERYRVPIGFSNHIIGPEACYAAVALGARVIEVHMTDRKHGRTFRDHELSMEPHELADLVAKLPRIRASLGSGGKARQAAEVANLSAVRKGLIAARFLSAGTILSAEDIAYARPATEFDSSERDAVVGRRLLQDVAAWQTIPRAGLAP